MNMSKDLLSGIKCECLAKNCNKCIFGVRLFWGIVNIDELYEVLFIKGLRIWGN